MDHLMREALSLVVGYVGPYDRVCRHVCREWTCFVPTLPSTLGSWVEIVKGLREGDSLWIWMTSVFSYQVLEKLTIKSDRINLLHNLHFRQLVELLPKYDNGDSR